MKKWVVSFQDGEDPTYVVLDELPIIALIDEKDLEDPNFRLPTNCVDIGENHIHIKDLLDDWYDLNPEYEKLDAGVKE